MGYLTARGRTVEYPYTLAAKVVCTQNDDLLEIVNATAEIFRELQYADYELITLRQENLRLKHENEFMIKLINSRDNEE